MNSKYSTNRLHFYFPSSTISTSRKYNDISTSKINVTSKTKYTGETYTSNPSASSTESNLDVTSNTAYSRVSFTTNTYNSRVSLGDITFPYKTMQSNTKNMLFSTQSTSTFPKEEGIFSVTPKFKRFTSNYKHYTTSSRDSSSTATESSLTDTASNHSSLPDTTFHDNNNLTLNNSIDNIDTTTESIESVQIGSVTSVSKYFEQSQLSTFTNSPKLDTISKSSVEESTITHLSYNLIPTAIFNNSSNSRTPGWCQTCISRNSPLYCFSFYSTLLFERSYEAPFLCKCSLESFTLASDIGSCAGSYDVSVIATYNSILNIDLGPDLHGGKVKGASHNHYIKYITYNCRNLEHT